MDNRNTIHRIIARHPGKKLVIFGAGKVMGKYLNIFMNFNTGTGWKND